MRAWVLLGALLLAACEESTGSSAVNSPNNPRTSTTSTRDSMPENSRAQSSVRDNGRGGDHKAMLHHH